MSGYLYEYFPFPGQATDILEALRDEPHVFLLDSQRPDSGGRFSFLGFAPFATFSAGGKNFLPALKKKFSEFHRPRLIPAQRMTPFAFGIMGYLSYDLGLHLENIPIVKKDDLPLPEGFFGFYDCVITVDHFLKKMIVSSSGWPEKNSVLRKKRAGERLGEVRKILGRVEARRKTALSRRAQNSFPANRSKNSAKDIRSSFTKAGYIKAVKLILDHIRRGEVYQVNLSQRFEFNWAREKDTVALYKKLKDVFPTNYSGYFDGGNFRILTGSPECFLKLTGPRLMTRPMKGTRPRGKDKDEDRRQRNSLLKSAKDRAELLMITDLERNDLGRVCEYSSVRVKQMRALERYRTVFQTTSTVEGRLRRDRDAFDVLSACFPGGSVTGCPKIRAMRIIEELEAHHRGIYTGALGYVDFSGDMDFNILIRTLLNYGDKIYFQSGGGIVADSVPEEEYQETLVKAAALKMALGCLP